MNGVINNTMLIYKLIVYVVLVVIAGVYFQKKGYQKGKDEGYKDGFRRGLNAGRNENKLKNIDLNKLNDGHFYTFVADDHQYVMFNAMQLELSLLEYGINISWLGSE